MGFWRKKGSFRSALVTGATSGLGYEIARQLFQEVDRLIITGRDEKRLKWVVEELSSDAQASSKSIVAVKYDFLQPLDGSDLLHRILQDVPQILVNNAGCGWYGLFHEEPFEKEREVIDVNYTKTLEITYRWIKRVLDERRERQLYALSFVSSMAAFLPIPGLATYAAAKAALLSSAEAIRGELEYIGAPISVLTVCPGQFDTGFQETAAHKVQDERAVSKRTSLHAARIAEKFVRRILSCGHGVYVPYPWNIQRWCMRLLPQPPLRRNILERLLGRVTNGEK